VLAKIFIVDDHDHVRRQLRRLIELQGDWVVCCEAVSGKEAVEKHSREAQVPLMDFNMPEMDGLKASRLILLKCPDASILMVTVFWSPQLCDEARKVGLKGVCFQARIRSYCRRHRDAAARRDLSPGVLCKLP